MSTLTALALLVIQPAQAEQTYIVEFWQPGLVEHARTTLGPVVPDHVDAQDPDNQTYLNRLARQRATLLGELAVSLGELPPIVADYRAVTNGLALKLEPDQAERLAQHPKVKAVTVDQRYQLHTDAGPAWIQAPSVWAGGNQGERVVIGILDTGINWNHPAFADPGADGHDHQNPRGQQLGLCQLNAVRCNDKLIGVYDYTDEQSDGMDTDGHGSHVASIAAGNVRSTPIEAITTTFSSEVSGVAPHANLISYKVCVTDDPATPDVNEDGCSGSAAVQALDQAVLDGADILNYSIGGPLNSPWADLVARQMLSAREAGVMVVSSAGNSGPRAGSITSPANAPWVLAVGNISHDRRYANVLQELSGGAAPAPADMAGVGVTGEFGPARVVHARDFGNALCATGTPELQPNCNDHTGSSNPFPPGTFNGEIVVCDRGTYGRVEKGFNLREAGAGGYVLANTDDQAESIVSDDHCLPAVHIGDRLGDELRTWLAGGSDHSGSISGLQAERLVEFGDMLAASSSKGPELVVGNLLKPDLAAPGSNVLAAGLSLSEFRTGTSMASPHVVGMLALVLSDRPQLSPDQLHSIAVGSARNDQMVLSDGLTPAGGFAVGAGRARSDLAVAAGLSLQHAPGSLSLPSDARELNLAALVDDDCSLGCSFTRTVTDIAGGGRWQAVIDAPFTVSVTPTEFDLASGASQTLQVTIDVTGIELLNQWHQGVLTLTSDDPELSGFRLPLMIFVDGGRLPGPQLISTEHNRGSAWVEFEDLAPLSDLRLDATSLGLEQTLTASLPADDSNSEPYDSDQGTVTQLLDIAAGGALIVAIDSSFNRDFDLFVGRDSNGSGRAESTEELCRSTARFGAEECLLTDLGAGRYWVMAQNYSSNGGLGELDLRYTVMAPASPQLVATGVRQTAAFGEDFRVRVAWDQPQMRAGETWRALLQPRQASGALGSLPITVQRTERADADALVLDSHQPLLLLDGQTTQIELEPDEAHGSLFIELPGNTASVQVTGEASGPIEWLTSFEPATFVDAAVPLTTASDLSSDPSSSFSQLVELDQAGPGRLYVVPINRGDAAQGVSITATLRSTQQDSASPVYIEPLQGLYYNPERSGAGINLNLSDSELVLQWYTYLEDGTPTWYLAQAPIRSGPGDQWRAELGYFNYDGQSAVFHDVGEIVLTLLSPTDFVLSYRLHGRSGTESYTALAPDCAPAGPVAQRTGLWFLPDRPGFGYSVLSQAQQQVQINYLYDSQGFPRWVLGQGAHEQALDLAQFSGFCPTCAVLGVSSQTVGTNSLEFTVAGRGVADTDLQFQAPLLGSWKAAGAMSKLTAATHCEI